MGRLNTLHAQVKELLEEYPMARNDDRFLMTAVYVKKYGVNPYSPFKDVMKRYDLPPFESIRRTRQKVQADNPELRADFKVEEIRMELQREYIEYARGEEA